jgi:hypothetical protein
MSTENEIDQVDYIIELDPIIGYRAVYRVHPDARVVHGAATYGDEEGAWNNARMLARDARAALIRAHPAVTVVLEPEVWVERITTVQTIETLPWQHLPEDEATT